jgi:hypothetical protein
VSPGRVYYALAAVGLVALVAALIGRPPTDDWFLGVSGVLSSALIGGALAQPLRRLTSWPLAVAALTLLLVGALALAADLVRDESLWSVLVLVAAVGVAYVVPRRSSPAEEEWLLTVLAAAFPFAALTVAAWLDHFDRLSSTNAGYAAGASGVVFDVLVLQLVRERFGEHIWRERAVRPPDLDRFTRGIWVELPSYGIPAILGLFAVWTTAAPALGTDDAAGGSAPHLLAILGFAVAAAILAGLGLAAALLARPERRRPELRPSAPSLAATVAGALVWLAAGVWLLEAPLHFKLAAGVAALVTGFLIAENVLSASAILQAVEARASGWVTALVTGSAGGAAIFWLLTTGLWSGERPATAGSAGVATLIALLGTATVGIACGAAATFWTSVPRLTLNPGYTNVVQDQLLYGFLALLGVVIPAFGVAHLQAADVDNAGIATVASLTVIPSLLFAYRWVINNNRDHLASELERDVEGVARERARTDGREANAIERERKTKLTQHVNMQIRVSFWYLVVGYVWLLATAILD